MAGGEGEIVRWLEGRERRVVRKGGVRGWMCCLERLLVGVEEEEEVGDIVYLRFCLWCSSVDEIGGLWKITRDAFGSKLWNYTSE